MKRLFASVILLAIIILLSITSEVIINRYNEDLSYTIADCQSGYDKEKILLLKNKWKGYKPYMMFFVNRNDIDEIDKYINFLEFYTDDDFNNSCEEIIFSLNRIKEKENLSFSSLY